MLREEIEAKVAEFHAIQPWNHNFSLPYGIQTRPGQQMSQGKNLIKLERLKPLLDVMGVAGKRVLDVGCNEGFFSFYLAEQGAQVLGIDIDENRVQKAQFIRSVLDRKDVDLRVLDIYSEEFSRLPAFDLCICLGFLHRVPDPYSALAALTARTNLILLEWKALKFGPHDDAFAYFTPKDVVQDDYYGTEYWLLSYAAVERVLKRLRFSYFHRVDDPRQRRAVLIAGKVDNPIFHRPDQVVHRGRLPALLSHTKRYVRVVIGILTGRVNA